MTSDLHHGATTHLAMPFDHTAVDLDLVYVTDRIILMGYPATGFEGLYRNKRRDVLRFINARHGDKWWVWNLHKERLERAARAEAKTGTPVEDKQDGWVLVGEGTDVAQVATTDEGGATLERPVSPQPRPASVAGSTSSSTTTISRPSPPPSARIHVITRQAGSYDPIDVGDEDDEAQRGQRDRRDGRVDEVFRLHSSRRMKPTSTGRGVSIPSQRRWCRYVHMLYTGQAPPCYFSDTPSRIRLASVTLLLRPAMGWMKPVTSLVFGSGGTGEGKACATIARYDDGYVEKLRQRGGGQGLEENITQGGMEDDRWDRRKMFRSCGKLVPADLDEDARAALHSSANSCVVHHLVPPERLVLDRAREFRTKLHLGALPLGWAWLIPAFHLPEPLPGAPRTHALHLPRNQIDFALGPGASIQEVIVRLEEVVDEEHVGGMMSDEEEAVRGVRGDDDEQARDGLDRAEA
ncbi:Telomerase protein component 1 [Cryptotrichosporon argae]